MCGKKSTFEILCIIIFGEKQFFQIFRKKIIFRKKQNNFWKINLFCEKQNNFYKKNN